MPRRLRIGLHIPSAAISHGAATRDPSSNDTSTRVAFCSRSTKDRPSTTFTPTSRARRTRASSSSSRGAMAANRPSEGRGTKTSRPDGERNHAPSTSNHWGTASGRTPRDSSCRRARVVSPSPQHLSRGNVALSTSTTERPAWAAVMAAALPAGPAPTIRRSQKSVDSDAEPLEVTSVRLGAPLGWCPTRVVFL